MFLTVLICQLTVFPMDMESIKGKVIGLVLNNARGLMMAGHDAKVHKTSFFTRVVGFDVFGLWVESRYRGLKSHVYFPWGNVKSIVYLPDERDMALNGENTCLGFGCSVRTLRSQPKLRSGKKRVAHRSKKHNRKHPARSSRRAPQKRRSRAPERR
jgi:hypothetical protein